MKIGINVKKIYQNIFEILQEYFTEIMGIIQNHENRINTLENSSGGASIINQYVIDFYNYENTLLKSTNTQILNDNNLILDVSFSTYFNNFDIAPIEYNKIDLGRFKICNTSEGSNLYECYGTIPCIYQIGFSSTTYNGLIQIIHHSTTDEEGNNDNYCTMELCIDTDNKTLFTDNANILNELFRVQANGIIPATEIIAQPM